MLRPVRQARGYSFWTKHGDHLVGLPPLHRAVDRGSLRIVQLLLQDAQGDPSLDFQHHPSGFTAFAIGCRDGHLGIVKALVEKGCNTRLTTGRGQTGLELARENRHVDICKFLAEPEPPQPEETFDVQVPRGVQQAGRVVQAEVKGRQYLLDVPVGLTPGQSFSVRKSQLRSPESPEAAATEAPERPESKQQEASGSERRKTQPKRVRQPQPESGGFERRQTQPQPQPEPEPEPEPPDVPAEDFEPEPEPEPESQPEPDDFEDDFEDEAEVFGYGVRTPEPEPELQAELEPETDQREAQEPERPRTPERRPARANSGGGLFSCGAKAKGG